MKIQSHNSPLPFIAFTKGDVKTAVQVAIIYLFNAHYFMMLSESPFSNIRHF